MSNGFGSATFGAGCDVGFDERGHLGPPVPSPKGSEGFGDPGMSCELVIVEGSGDEEAKVGDLGDVDGTVVEEETCV